MEHMKNNDSSLFGKATYLYASYNLSNICEAT
jgi:hypothetical protein